MTDIPVTQADREAMVAYEKLSAIPLGGAYAEAILAGKYDRTPRVQAFARHRLASTPQAEEIGELVERLRCREQFHRIDGQIITGGCVADIEAVDKAADTILSLQAENERLKTEAEGSAANFIALHNEAVAAQAQVARMREAHSERRFRMQGGPMIPWSLAETIYEAYSALYGTQQSLQRLHERGGFGWKEVEIIFGELRKRKRDVFDAIHAKDVAAVRARLALAADAPNPGDGE